MLYYVMVIEMRRTQVQLEEELYRRLREEAHIRRTSMAAVIREALRAHLGLTPKPKRRRLEEFAFVGSGRSEQEGLRPISEWHDEALAQFSPDLR